MEAARVAHGSSGYLRLARRARWLSWASLGYMALEGNALLGAWWLDSAVALLIAYVAIQEGREAWRGDACC